MSGDLRRARLLFDDAANEAVAGAIKAKLGEMDDYRRPINYITADSKYRCFAFDVIGRYEEAKRKRSIFRWYYRWRHGR